MSRSLAPLLNSNRPWAARIEAREPGFFTPLARQQSPRCMWIGCGDSRVPANEIVGLDRPELIGPVFSAVLKRGPRPSSPGASEAELEAGPLVTD